MKITQETKTVYKLEGTEYGSLRELQYAALSALVTGVEAPGEIIDHADAILEILSLG